MQNFNSNRTKTLVMTSLSVSMLMLSLSACQTNPSNKNAADTLPTNSPSVIVQKSPNNSADMRSNKPFSEIPLITESNRPADFPDAYTPPFGLTDKASHIEASWHKPAIAKSATDAVYLQESAKSETKGQCPILALPTTATAHLANRRVRRANFSGGWGVAYDLPNLRSAYGVALSGISEPIGKGTIWQDYYLYEDGTELTYGREGGDSQGQWLAYLTLGKQYSPASQYCFYNIWSQQSKGHLEQIISHLRIVSP